MTAPEISIIIPVYNAAAYIEQCIRSVLNQTMQDIEIIAVNDGSTDESKQILNRLAATDERLHVFHQNNKGVSATRNFGLQQATGNYIGFCDADDWMEPDMLQKLYTAIASNECDWAICNVTIVRDEQPAKLRLQLSDEVINVADDRAEFVHGLMRFNYDNANWNKLFKASIIREQQLRFNEHMHIWEDLLFNLQYLQYASKVVIVAKPLYNYRILDTSLYSGDTSNKVPQFNKLFNYYVEFANRLTDPAQLQAFKAEMARITYNQLLYQAEVQVKKEHHFFPNVVKGYRNELKRFNPAIFSYTTAERKGLQGIKRQLLQQHQFGLFAIIIAAKPFLRKPYHLVRRLLKR
jgi:glycosyltransferase involved in cell wall biosynthesis